MTGELEFDWIEDDSVRSKLAIIGYVGYFKLLSGYSKTTYWSVEDLKQHGVKYSKTFKFGKGVWNDNFDAMARKTVLKLMLNKGDAPMSVEMQEAIKYDQSVILDEQGNHRYVDNEKPSAQEKLDAIANEEKKYEEAEVVDVEYSASGEISFE
jgi:recombination protein RecT